MDSGGSLNRFGAVFLQKNSDKLQDVFFLEKVNLEPGSVAL